MVRRRSCAVSNHEAAEAPHPPRRGEDAAPLDEVDRARGSSFISSRSGMQAPPATGGLRAMSLAEELGELFGDRAAEFLGVDNGHGAAIVARDVVADADRDQLDRRAGLDLLDDVAQVPFQIVAGID